ncbi:putative MFS family arabinose efflux permease [Elusimicrobium posterum]|uniref:MFS transporter n=1 Tax=Elusimicrobium posterum TaxID=3116653 RepID=UPI003C740C25
MPVKKGYKKIPLIRLLTMEGCTAMARYTMMLVLPWYILQTSAGALGLGASAFAMMMPGIFGAYIGGVIIEKLGARKTILLSDVAQLLCTLVIFFCMYYPFVPLYFLVFMVFLSAFFYNPGKVARGTVIPLYARFGRVNVQKAYGAREAVSGAAAIAGPLAGGILIAHLGISVTIYFCMVFFSIAAVLCLKMLKLKEKGIKFKARSSSKKTILYILKRKNLLLALLFTMPFFFLGYSWENIILPSYIDLHGYGSVYFGMLEGAFGVGILLGALAFAAYEKEIKFNLMLILNYIAYIIPLIIFLLPVGKSVVLAASFIGGIPFGAYAAFITTFLTQNSPQYMRPRVLGIYTSLCAVAEVIGILAISFSMDIFKFNLTIHYLLLFFLAALFLSLLTDIKSKHERSSRC